MNDFSNMDDQPKNTDEVEMHWYFPHYSKDLPGAAIISGDYKFIEYYDPDKFEMYDLSEDPGERNDLSGNPAFRWKFKELQEKLRKWLYDVDPIMHTMNPKYDKPK